AGVLDREPKRVPPAMTVRYSQRRRIPGACRGIGIGSGRFQEFHREGAAGEARVPIGGAQVIADDIALNVRHGEWNEVAEGHLVPEARQLALEYFIEVGVDLERGDVIHLPDLRPGAGGSCGEALLIAERIALDLLVVATAHPGGTEHAQGSAEGAHGAGAIDELCRGIEHIRRYGRVDAFDAADPDQVAFQLEKARGAARADARLAGENTQLDFD